MVRAERNGPVNLLERAREALELWDHQNALPTPAPEANPAIDSHEFKPMKRVRFDQGDGYLRDAIAGWNDGKLQYLEFHNSGIWLTRQRAELLRYALANFAKDIAKPMPGA